MTLPINVPFLPIEALSVAEIPEGEKWQYEPKWDGFRCLGFRDDSEVQLQSKAGQPLERYFPELVAPSQCTMDQLEEAKSSPLLLLDRE